MIRAQSRSVAYASDPPYLTPYPYGATPTDPTVDNTVAMQAAWDAASALKLPLDLMGQEWWCTTGYLAGDSDLEVRNGTINFSQGEMLPTNSHYVIRCQAPPPTPAVDLLMDVTSGSETPVRVWFPIGTLAATGIENNSVLYLESDQPILNTIVLGQTVLVKTTGTDSGMEFAELNGSTRFNFLVADNARMRKINSLRNIRFTNFNLIGCAPLVVVDPGVRQGGMTFDDCRDVVLTNIEASNFTQACVNLVRPWHAEVRNLITRDTPSWYGLAITYAAHGVVIDGLECYNNRHGVTIGSANHVNLGSGFPLDINVSNFISESRAAGMDVHIGADIKFRDGFVNCGGDPLEESPSGVLHRGLSGSITNVHVTGHSSAGAVWQPLMDGSSGLKGMMTIDNVTVDVVQAFSETNHAIMIFTLPDKVPIGSLTISAAQGGPFAGGVKLQANGTDIETAHISGIYYGSVLSGIYIFALNGAHIRAKIFDTTVIMADAGTDTAILLRPGLDPASPSSTQNPETSTITVTVDNVSIRNALYAVNRFDTFGTLIAKLDLDTDAATPLTGFLPTDTCLSANSYPDGQPFADQDTGMLFPNGDVLGWSDGSLAMGTAAVPASASDDGSAGMIRYEAGFLYVCVATDTWQRVAIATFP